MSRPIPVEIIPSHLHLSDEDHAALFGTGNPATVEHTLSQTGQFAYAEHVEVRGKLKRTLSLRVLGPSRRQTQVELTPTEAQLLGIDAQVARSGDFQNAVDCTLTGPSGSIDAKASVIIPQVHLHCSDAEAALLHLTNGKVVALDFMGDHPGCLENVAVRVHPSYRLRLHVHPDIAREHWLLGLVHVTIRDSASL